MPTWALAKLKRDQDADAWAAPHMAELGDEWERIAALDFATKMAGAGFQPDGQPIPTTDTLDLHAQGFAARPDVVQTSISPIAPKALGGEWNEGVVEEEPMDMDQGPDRLPQQWNLRPQLQVAAGPLPFIPIGQPPPTKEQHERASEGESPVQSLSEAGAEMLRLGSAQHSTSPAAVGHFFGVGPDDVGHAVRGTKRILGDFSALPAAGRGAGDDALGQGVRAAGEAGGNGGRLLGPSGQPIRSIDEVMQIVDPREEVISTVSTAPKSAILRTGEEGEAVPAVSDKIAHLMPNLRRLGPDVHATVIRTVQENPDEMLRFQQGKISFAEQAELASRLGMTVEEFLKHGPGKAYNEHELLALRATAVKTVDRAKNLGLLIEQMGGAKNANPEDKAQMVRAMLDAAGLIARVRGGAATAGRTLGQMRQTVTQRLAAGVTGANEEVAQLRSAQTALKESHLSDRRALARKGIAAIRRESAEDADDLEALFDQLEKRAYEPAASKQSAESLDLGVRPLGQAERQLGVAEELTDVQAALNELPRVSNAADPLARVETKLGAVEDDLGKAWDAAFQRLDKAVNQRAARSEQARIYREYQKGMAEWRQAQRELDKQDAAYEKLVNELEAKAGKESVKQYQTAEKVLGKVAGREITDDLIDSFVDIVKSNDPYAVAAFVRGLENPSWYDRIQLLRIAGMLGATTTQALNTISSAGNVALTLGPQHWLASGMDALTQVGLRAIGRDGERTRYAGESGAQIGGAWQGFRAGLKDAPRVFTTGLSPASVSELENLPTTLNTGYPKVDTAVEAPLRLLTTVDHVLYTTALGGRYAGIAERQAIHEGLKGEARSARAGYIRLNPEEFPELFDEAATDARRMIFRERRPEMQALMRVPDSVFGLRVAKDHLATFMRTPYNVAAQAAGMTPAGFGAAINSARQGRRGEAQDRATRALMGTFVTGLGMVAGYNGYATTGYPEQSDPTRHSQPMGRIPWAARIPIDADTAEDVEFKNIGPLAFPLAVGVTIGDAWRRGEKVEISADMINRVGLAFLSYAKDQSWLQGMAAVSDFFESPGAAAKKVGENVARSYMPASGIQRQVDRGILGNPEREYDGPVEAWMSGSPLTNQGLPVKQDRLGKPVQREHDPLTWALSFFARTGVERDTPVLRAFREAGVGLPARPKQRENIPLEREEQRFFERNAGRVIEDAVAEAMRHPDWKAASPDEKAEALRDIIREARDEAEGSVLGNLSDEEIIRRLDAEKAKKQPVGVR